MKWLLVFLLMLVPIQTNAGWDESDNPPLAYEDDATDGFDYSKFYFVKMAVKKEMLDAIMKTNEINMRHEVAINATRELQTRLIKLQAGGLPFEFSLYTNMLEADRMLLILILKYSDEKGSIEWELDAMSNGVNSYFFSRIYDGKQADSFDDYYVWERLVRE